MDIHALLEKKKGLVQAADEIRTRVYAEQNGEWRGDEEKKFDGLLAEADQVTAQIERLAKLEAAQRSITGAEQPQGRRTEPTAPEGRSQGQTKRVSAADHAKAMLGWFMAGSNRRSAAHAEAAARCGINTEDKTLFLGLAAKPPASTRSADLQEWEQRYLGVDIVSPDLGGHYLVPNETMRALEVALLSFGGMRSAASVLRTDTGAALPIPTMNDTSNEGAIIGEGTQETNEVFPDIGQLILEAYTYSSRKIPVSVEFMQDNAINFAARVGELLGTRIARITNRHFTVGSGNGQPKGIVTAAANSNVTAVSATAVSYDNIVDLVHSVDPAYRTGAKFMFADTMLRALKKIKVPQFSGDTAGYPLWKAGMAVGDPDTIDSYGYVINQHMPPNTTGEKAIVFGDLSKYQIRDVRLVEVQRLNELRAEFRQVLWLAWSRHDGDLLDAGTGPVKYLTMA